MSAVSLSNDPIDPRCEPAGEIWWRGRQLAVTSYGIKRLDRQCYVIEVSQLLANDWPEHMAGKGGIDLNEFITAWLVALTMHGQGAKSPDYIRQSIGQARAERDRYDTHARNLAAFRRERYGDPPPYIGFQSLGEHRRECQDIRDDRDMTPEEIAAAVARHRAEKE